MAKPGKLSTISGIAAIFAFIFGVLGLAHPSAITQSASHPLFPDFSYKMGLGLYTAIIEMGDYSETDGYDCKDLADIIFLDMEEMFSFDDDLFSFDDDLFSFDDDDDNDEDGDNDGRRRKRRDAKEDTGDGLDSASDKMFGNMDCKDAIANRCSAGKGCGIVAVACSFFCIISGLVIGKKVATVVFNVFAWIFYLICMALLAALASGPAEMDNSACGADGEFEYGAAFIVIILAFIIHFVGMFLACCDSGPQNSAVRPGAN